MQTLETVDHLIQTCLGRAKARRKYLGVHSGYGETLYQNSEADFRISADVSLLEDQGQ